MVVEQFCDILWCIGDNFKGVLYLKKYGDCGSLQHVVFVIASFFVSVFCTAEMNVLL